MHAKRHHHICAAKIVAALLKFVSGFQATFRQLSANCQWHVNLVKQAVSHPPKPSHQLKDLGDVDKGVLLN